MKMNDKVKTTIGEDIRAILGDSTFGGWDAEQHLEEAVRVFIFEYLGIG